MIKRRSRDLTERTRPINIRLGTALDTLYNTSSGGGNLYYMPAYNEAAMQGTYAYYRNLRTTSVGLVPAFQGSETMISSGLRPPAFNECLHSKHTLVNYPYLLWNAGYNGYTYNWLGYWREPYNVSYSCKPRITPLNIGNYLDDLGFSSRAYWSMRPKFEGQVSLMNSIFELKDFRDLAKNLLKTGSLFKTAYQQTRQLSGLKTQSLFPGMKRIEPTRALAEGYLTKQFAIDPTVKDFLAISAQCATSAKEAQDKFAQDGVDGKSMHYRENIFQTNDVNIPSPNNNYYCYGQGERSSFVRNATAKMKYSYTKRNTLSAMIHYWGLSGTAEAFWNMLPWSFVADYFLSVGKSLSMMRTDPNVVLNEYQYCESATYESTAGTHIVLDPRVYHLIVDGKYYSGTTSAKRLLVSGEVMSVYKRLPKEPYKGPALPRLKLPSNTQMVNMGALVRCLF